MLSQRTRQVLTFSLLATVLLLAGAQGDPVQPATLVEAGAQEDVETRSVSLDIEGMT